MTYRALRLYTRLQVKTWWDRTLDKRGTVIAVLVGGACVWVTAVVVAFVKYLITGE